MKSTDIPNSSLLVGLSAVRGLPMGHSPNIKEHVGNHWTPLAEGRIRCDLCPRGCVLMDGQRGFCFVRQNVNGRMILTTYGYSSGFCVDPIEKKPLNQFYPGTSVLSFGTAGCNLGCKFCQNWDISKAREFNRLTEQAQPDAIAAAAKRLGCTSVAFTYNDPVVFAEYAQDTASACHDVGVKTVAVTAGYITEAARGDFFQHMDAANVDLKAFSERFYQQVTLGSLSAVLDTLVYLREQTSVWLEITTLLIPGENDDEREITAMCRWIRSNLGVSVPLHFTAFHPDFRMMDYPPTPPATLQRSRQIALAEGLRYVYTGNIQDTVGGSTYCHQCGGVLIERDGYELKAYNLVDQNHCGHCSAVCAGHFSNQPGDWGSRRLPVRIH